MSRVGPGNEPRRNRIGFAAGRILLALFGLIASMGPAASEDTKDWITALAREPIHIEAWPGGKKVAICFVLYVEVWGYGHGPNFRSDMDGRDPDIVDELFRQYAVYWGIPRVGRLFNEQEVPLSIALNELCASSSAIGHGEGWCGSFGSISSIPLFDWKMTIPSSRPALRQSAARSGSQGCRRERGGTGGAGAQRP